jgi:hypothetical protein
VEEHATFLPCIWIHQGYLDRVRKLNVWTSVRGAEHIPGFLSSDLQQQMSYMHRISGTFTGYICWLCLRTGSISVPLTLICFPGSSHPSTTQRLYTNCHVSQHEWNSLLNIIFRTVTCSTIAILGFHSSALEDLELLGSRLGSWNVSKEHSTFILKGSPAPRANQPLKYCSWHTITSQKTLKF